MFSHLSTARLFVEFLRNPDLRVILVKPYSNKYGIHGVRCVAELYGQLAYISVSRTTVASTPERLAMIFSKPELLDPTKEAVYWAYRRLGTGLRIEAWDRGKWFQIFLPIP